MTAFLLGALGGVAGALLTLSAVATVGVLLLRHTLRRFVR